MLHAAAPCEHYESRQACLNGIDSGKRNADAPIQDTTWTNQAPLTGAAPLRKGAWRPSCSQRTRGPRGARRDHERCCASAGA